MNQDQWLSLLRSLLTMFGPLLVAKGLVSAADEGALITATLGIVGSLMTFGPTVWGVFVHTHEAAIAAVNANTETTGVKVVAATSPSPKVHATIPPGT